MPTIIVADDFIYHGRGWNLCINIRGRRRTDRDRKILLIICVRGGSGPGMNPSAASRSARTRSYRISCNPRGCGGRNDKRPRRGGGVGIRYIEVYIKCIYPVNNIIVIAAVIIIIQCRVWAYIYIYLYETDGWTVMSRS